MKVSTFVILAFLFLWAISTARTARLSIPVIPSNASVSANSTNVTNTSAPANVTLTVPMSAFANITNASTFANFTSTVSVNTTFSIPANATFTSAPANVTFTVPANATFTSAVNTSAPANITFSVPANATFTSATTTNTTSTNITNTSASANFTSTVSVNTTFSVPVNATFSPANASGSIPVSGTSTSCTESLSCVSEGDSCDFSWTTNSQACSKNSSLSCCAIGLMCNASVCATNNVGASCKHASDCKSYAGEILFCTASKVCAYRADAGDEYDSDNNIFCAEGLNATEGTCTGQKFNQSCSEDLPCNNGLFCNGTCQYLGGLKDTCQDSSQCLPNLECSGGFCSSLFNLAEGKNCSYSNQCSSGNVCSKKTYICVNPVTEIVKCSKDSECNAGETCQCSQFTGDSFCLGPLDNINGCANDNENALNCQAKYNCTSQSANTDSCFYNSCYDELKAAQSCNCDNGDAYYGSSCFYNQYCSNGLPGWAIALIIIAIIYVVIAVIGVLYVVLKPRNTYDSI